MPAPKWNVGDFFITTFSKRNFFCKQKWWFFGFCFHLSRGKVKLARILRECICWIYELSMCMKEWGCGWGRVASDWAFLLPSTCFMWWLELPSSQPSRGPKKGRKWRAWEPQDFVFSEITSVSQVHCLLVHFLLFVQVLFTIVFHTLPDYMIVP